MKQFKSRHEAWSYYNKYEKTNEDIPQFWTEYDLKNQWSLGDHILIQHETAGTLSKPIYAIFAGYNVWDQALVVFYVEKHRAWTWHCEVQNSSDSKYYTQYCNMDPQVDSIELWTGNIKVLGWWKYKPTIGQLKEALTGVKPVIKRSIVTNAL